MGNAAGLGNAQKFTRSNDSPPLDFSDLSPACNTGVTRGELSPQNHK